MSQIADELRVSESQVGLLITVLAGTVVLTAAPLAVLTRRFSRLWVLFTDGVRIRLQPSEAHRG